MKTPKGVPEEAVDQLYRGPLEEFTATRNELAHELRDAGERAAGDWVAKLKKPTRAAWLVNQLAERKPAQVQELLDAGEGLRRGQEDLLAGNTDAGELRSAARAVQHAIGELLETASALAREHGSSGQVVDRVGETLQAASADPEVAEAIKHGRLVREQRASSVGFAAAASGLTARGAKRPDTAKQRRQRQQDEKHRKEMRARVTAAEKAVKAAARKLGKAREQAAEREIELKSAEEELDNARKELEDQTG
jgi:hypothetical protein